MYVQVAIILLPLHLGLATPTTEVIIKSDNKIVSLWTLMETLTELKKEIKEMKELEKTMSSQISNVNSDINIIKTQINGLRSEMNTVKTDIEASVEKESSEVKKSIISEITLTKKCMVSQISDLGKDTSKISRVQSIVDHLRSDMTNVKSGVNLLLYAPPYPQYGVVFKGYGSCHHWEGYTAIATTSLEDCLAHLYSLWKGDSSWNDVHYGLTDKSCFLFKGGEGHDVEHNKIHYHIA